MKVAVFSRFPRDPSIPSGGVVTVTVALVRALAAVPGIELHVVTLEPDLKRIEVSYSDGATVHRLPGSRVPQMIDVLAGPGRRRLKQFLVELAPDVVHLHETYGLGIGRLPMPYVVTIHGFDDQNVLASRGYLAWLRAPLWRRIQAWGIARQRHIISITPYVRKMIEPLTRARIYDIDNPVSQEYFHVVRRAVPGRIFSAGWVSRRKNTLGVVEALARVIRSGLEASLHIAGAETEREYSAQVHQAVRELGLTDRVSFLGFVGPETIRRELSEASVFVLPSLQENAPVAIAEAMAAGVPVVSSNRCGMPHMIQEGETGFLVDPEDSGALADRITRLLSDDHLRQRMGAAARHTAESRFHPDSVARKTVAVYQALLHSQCH